MVQAVLWLSVCLARCHALSESLVVRPGHWLLRECRQAVLWLSVCAARCHAVSERHGRGLATGYSESADSRPAGRDHSFVQPLM